MTFDCQSCGACCQALPSYADHKAYVRIYDADIARMSSEQVEKFTKRIYPAPTVQRGMRLVGKRCAALEGKVGDCVSCQIYENRPSVCRVFEKDSDICMLAREEAWLGEFCQG
jgi:Fe-S-cluster containining protein